MAEPYLYDGYATGAIHRPPDSRDWQLLYLPEVVQRLSVGLPQQFYVTPMEEVPEHVKLNQGPVPKCVASSSCIAKSVQEWFDLRRWQAYNDDELYRACGGTGSTGIYTDAALQYARDTGLLLADGSRRYKIASYMFAPKQYRLFRETLAAALIETGPCVIALQLPVAFGWNSGEGLQGPQSYHQMELHGYEGLEDNDWAVFLNSWGSGFGQRGFVRVRWNSIETNGSFQGGYGYGYKLADFVDEGTQPDPQPDPDPQPQPEPQPQPRPIVVTGYGTARTVPAVEAGQAFGVLGSGFDGAGILQAQWGAYPLEVRERTAQALTVVAPAATGLNRLSVRIEGTLAAGPYLAVQGDGQPEPQPDPGPDPNPEPQPQPDPGGLTVEVKTFRQRSAFITVRVLGATGGGVATLTVTQSGQPVPVQQGRPLRAVEAWQGPYFLPSAVPGEIVVRVEAEGRSGEVRAIVP